MSSVSALVVEPVVVAVDGPAGSGKSSVSKAAARVLGYSYLDTGACYRAFAWSLLERGVELEDPAAVIAGFDDYVFDISTDPDAFYVRVGETDVTTAIREERTTGAVRHISKLPEVREGLNTIFRRIASSTNRPGIVIEGRDITTVVAPDAPVRVLLTASEEVRMARRAAEISGSDAAVVSEQLKSRDAADLKVVDFMNAADGVSTLDSSDLNFEETVAALVELVNNRPVSRAADTEHDESEILA